MKYLFYSLFITLTLLILGIYQNQTFARDLISIEISKNNTSIFSKKLSRELNIQEKLGNIKIYLDSQENIALQKNNNDYKIWVAPGIKSGTGKLILSTKTQDIIIELKMSMPKKSQKDFSIFQDMLSLHLQEKALSCEVSATSDILSTLIGRKIYEQDVIGELPKSIFFEKLPQKTDSGFIWGNPQEGFVGYIDNTQGIVAKQKLMTGYGVYEKPISLIYKAYNLETEIITQDIHNSTFSKNDHISYLLKQVQVGNMVQLWGDWCTDERYDDGTLSTKKELTIEKALSGISAKNTCYNIYEARKLIWSYTDMNAELKNHIGLDGEHAFILLGWKGDITQPTHIKVWDTDTGYHTYPLQEWMRKWEKMQYRSIVIKKL